MTKINHKMSSIIN